MYLGATLFSLAVFAWIYAIVEYARSSWYTNTDVMGASMVFMFWWLIGGVFVEIGLIAIGVRSIPWLIGTPIAAGAIGKFMEWFVLEPALSFVFKDYRRRAFHPTNQQSH